ncbi:MAG: PAS domain S-box protein, partial [Desulfotomaculaceae bacterium]
RDTPDSYVGKNNGFRPYFTQPLLGQPGRYFALGVTSGERGYYASYPVRDGYQNIIGVAVIKRKIESVESSFRQYPYCFCVDPHGIVFFSSQPDQLFKSLWPLDEAAQKVLIDSRQFGSGPFNTLGLPVVADGSALVLEGQHFYVTRKFINPEGWSVVLFTPTHEINAAWLLGLFITFCLSVLTILFFLGMYRFAEYTARISASEENYRSIFNGVNEAILVHELFSGNIIDVNQKMCEMYGCTREEVLSAQMDMVVTSIPPYTTEEAYQLIRKASAGEPQLLEWLSKDITGRLFWIEVNLKKALIGGKECVLAVVRDITRRKRAEEDLCLSEERFFKIFNASPAIMCISTLADGRFIDVNERFLHVMGYCREEIIGRTSTDISIWVNPERAEIIKIFYEKGMVSNLECKLRKKSGEVYTGLFSAEIVCFNGEQLVLSVINDITERKRLEEEMARLERLNLIGEMAAGIGHEIRNPMTTVRGFLQLLGGKKECIQFREYYDLMIEELDRANSIITEFLSLAKNKTLSKKAQNLSPIVGALLPLIQADAMRTDKYVKVELENIPDLLLDEKEIRQLILNLVRNGLEAMSPGGIITIRTFKDGSNVVLAVQDQGKGIEPDIMEKIGTPFFTTKDSGTGLGLAICYSIAARHEATIEVETSPRGTTFYVRFELQKSAEVA